MTEKQEEKIVLTLNEEEQQTVDTPLTDAEKEKLTPADITAAMHRKERYDGSNFSSRG